MNPTRLIGEWGADHWPLLAYIQTVMADCGEFEVGFDPHMRHNNMHTPFAVQVLTSLNHVEAGGVGK